MKIKGEPATHACKGWALGVGHWKKQSWPYAIKMEKWEKIHSFFQPDTGYFKTKAQPPTPNLS